MRLWRCKGSYRLRPAPGKKGYRNTGSRKRAGPVRTAPPDARSTRRTISRGSGVFDLSRREYRVIERLFARPLGVRSGARPDAGQGEGSHPVFG